MTLRPSAVSACLAAVWLGGCATTVTYEPCAEARRLFEARAEASEVIRVADQCIEYGGGRALALSLRAAAKTVARDFEGAVADADEALALEPGVGFTLYYRGVANEALQRLDAARADFEAAAAAGLDARTALKAAGRAKVLSNDFPGAFADFDRLVALDPDDAEAYQLRGVSLVVMERYAAAQVDFSRAIALDPAYMAPVAARGFVRYWTGDYSAAVADFRAALDARPEGLKTAFLYFALIRSGVPVAQARAELADRGAEIDRTRYPGIFPALFLGEVSAEGMIAVAMRTGTHKPHENACEAYFYAGMERLLAGDREAARVWFEKSLATGVIRFDEVRGSRKELKALGVDVGPSPALKRPRTS